MLVAIKSGTAKYSDLVRLAREDARRLNKSPFRSGDQCQSRQQMDSTKSLPAIWLNFLESVCCLDLRFAGGVVVYNK